MTREQIEQRIEEIENELMDYFLFEELDELYSNLTPTEIFNKFFYGNIKHWRPKWVKINGYDNFDDGDRSHLELEEELEQLQNELKELEEDE